MTKRVLSAWRKLCERRALPRVMFALIVLVMLAYSWMPAGVSVPNERSRVYLSVALVDDHTVSIDGPIARFGGVSDLSIKDGHFYCDKAPGASFLGAIVYGVVRVFTPAAAWRADQLVNLMRNLIMIPMGLLGWWLLRRLLFVLTFDAVLVDVLALAWLLGTTAFHCSTSFVGHQIVAVSLIAALLLVVVGEKRVGDEPRGAIGANRFFGAGLCAGLATLTEYQSAIPVALLGCFVLAGPSESRFRAVVSFTVGVVPGLAALLWYNTLAFGGPFQLSYDHLANPTVQAVHSVGIGGVAWPHRAFALGGLTSLHRGLFATSPIFLLIAPGLFFTWYRGQRRLALLLGLCTAYYLLFISSTPMWFAGWGFGPRLLVPAMGWMMVLVAFAAVELFRWPVGRGVIAGLVIGGVVYQQSVHAVFPELPERFVNPFLDLVVPALRHRVTVPNLGVRLFGWSDVVGLIPLALIVVGVIAFIAIRLVRALSGWRPRAVTLLVALLVTAPLALVVARQGPTQPPMTDAFIRWMHQLSISERRLWRQN